jgi:hypothetical protein
MHSRPGRHLFLLFMFSAYVAALAALPLMNGAIAQNAQVAKKNASSASQGGSAPVQQLPQFEEADRNKDGFVDKSESAVVPGLSALFERADRNKDGKLDKGEFEKGLAIVEGRKP